ncbi:MAG TPA: squalene/phytoene synthase family protein [Steroidobacteraceae bacterium]
MIRALKTLDATYRARAIPLGSVRYWSWLFAASLQRAPLLGVFALLAEWNALTDPATDAGASRIKLSWWQEEIQRLIARRPVHPIGLYLVALPRASGVDFSPLSGAIDATIAEVSGVPLERSAELEPHACALRAGPLRLASQLASDGLEEVGLRACLGALAVADYLARATCDYRRQARHGRVPFAVEELLAAGLDNADLCADQPSAKLEGYLSQLRARAARSYEAAALALPDACRANERHLLVLAALGLKHLQRPTSGLESARLQDMLLAWSTARRAHG